MCVVVVKVIAITIPAVFCFCRWCLYHSDHLSGCSFGRCCRRQRVVVIIVVVVVIVVIVIVVVVDGVVGVVVSFFSCSISLCCPSFPYCTPLMQYISVMQWLE